MAKIEIVVSVRDGQTMSQYSMDKNDKVIFTNADPAASLVVKPKASGSRPFCDKNGNELPSITVPASTSSDVVKICKSFQGGEALYKTQIGTAAEEDPIIIFEKTMARMDFTTGVLVGVVVGAIITAIVLRSRSRQRPVQG